MAPKGSIVDQGDTRGLGAQGRSPKILGGLEDLQKRHGLSSLGEPWGRGVGKDVPDQGSGACGSKQRRVGEGLLGDIDRAM